MLGMTRFSGFLLIKARVGSEVLNLTTNPEPEFETERYYTYD